jgi:hypothetical protein
MIGARPVPIDFILISAAVYALSPLSPSRWLLAWMKPRERHQLDMVDTAGRILGYVGMILICKMIEKVIL